MDGEDRKYIFPRLSYVSWKKNWNMEINRYSKQISKHLQKKKQIKFKIKSFQTLDIAKCLT